MNKHLKHYPFGKITICGIFIVDPNILARSQEDLSCGRCKRGVKDAKKCREYVELPSHKEEMAIRKAQREDDRAAHLALKARYSEGMSWQEARAFVKFGI
jgi:hypothetical protein